VYCSLSAVCINICKSMCKTISRKSGGIPKYRLSLLYVIWMPNKWEKWKS